MAFLELKNVSVAFGSGTRRVETLAGVNLAVEQNEFVAIVGFSGSGKSTLINLLAGLVRPTSGEVLQNGVPIAGPGHERGIVFQNYSLLPWLTAFENVELAVRQVFPEMNRRQRRDWTMRHLETVKLSHAAEKRPGELSGGMRQRVSIARALAMRPATLLLDEPFGALDALTRATLQDELLRIWEEDRRTVVLITNDVDEAILTADRVVPLKPGPRASLGPSFPVDLPRPRDRREMNFCPDFRCVRNGVASYLAGLRQESRRERTETLPPRPQLVPKRFAPL